MTKLIPILLIMMIFYPIQVIKACSMYKITQGDKTIVGNNEDWISPNSKFWYEKGEDENYGVLYMGQLDDFSQGAINEVGLVFDGFANPKLAVEDTVGKKTISISTAISKIMQTMSTVKEVKAYLSEVNLSSLTSSQIVFVDRYGTYLIVEGDVLFIGKEDEKAFSNFYYSQIDSVADVPLDGFQKGLQFLKNSQGSATTDYCSNVMKSLASNKLFGTQYSTIYDLSTLTVRIYLFHDYSQYVEIDLINELKKGNHSTMIADLFPKESTGYQHYLSYNDTENPAKFLQELAGNSPKFSEEEFIAMGLNSIINLVGYEWLRERSNVKAAIQVFEYGTSIMPTNANLYDSLGEAYFINEDYDLASVSFKRSLTLNPKNDNAVKYLIKIESKTK
jgi:hypothetical protein